jgi:hypothetical protein
VTGRPPPDEEELGRLLHALPPAPTGWVAAAMELPRTRRELDAVIERASEDARFRSALTVDATTALRDAGFEPTPALVEALRRRLS